jgi:hypothetical protein
MSYTGKVILIRGCEVCVSFDIVNMDWSNKSLGCFAHFDGHRYEVGDSYPDPAKHTTGRPVECEQGADWNPRPIEEVYSELLKKGMISDADSWRKDARKRFRKMKRSQRKNGIGLTIEPQTGELA